MAYRNGTYVAFHAQGTSEPTESDMKYYRLLLAWNSNDSIEFSMNNSHDKTYAVRDHSSKETLMSRLRARINNSKNVVLIIGDRTRFDNDWLPFEIAHAVDVSKIPIIAAYPGFERITLPKELRQLWPRALADRIESGEAKVIHVPFKHIPIYSAIKQFSHNNLPPGSLAYYTLETYQQWGMVQ